MFVLYLVLTLYLHMYNAYSLCMQFCMNRTLLPCGLSAGVSSCHPCLLRSDLFCYIPLAASDVPVAFLLHVTYARFSHGM